MFLGTFEPNLLDKGRVVLPKKIREELGTGKMILTIGFEDCIFGFAPKEWDEVTRPELTRPLFSDKQGRDLRRIMCAQAVNVELDGQGRCIVPLSMLEFAGIGTEGLVIIGAGDHFEIWSKKRWQEYRMGLRQDQ
jgi:MraZ protein